MRHPISDAIAEHQARLYAVMSRKDRLRALVEHLRDPHAFTRCALARDKYGESVGPCQPDAIQWCTQGHMIHTSPDHSEAYLCDWLLDHRPPEHTDWERRFSVSQSNDRWGHAFMLRWAEYAAEAPDV